MDPDTVLQEIMATANHIVTAPDDAYPDDVVDLADKITSLHTWLSKGGFLPTAWTSTVRG